MIQVTVLPCYVSKILKVIIVKFVTRGQSFNFLGRFSPVTERTEMFAKHRHRTTYSRGSDSGAKNNNHNDSFLISADPIRIVNSSFVFHG